MNHRTTARLRATTVPRLAAGIVGLTLAATLTGCGSSDTTATDDSGSTETEAASGAPAGGGEMPGAFGTIAAIDGDVLQVQSEMSGQVAVTVAAGTTITDQVEATFADLAVGACVVVQTPDDSEAAETAAASVSISSAGDDGCAAGAGGSGGMPADMPTDMPTDIPTDMPTDMPTEMQGERGGFGVRGEVTAIGGNGFTVLATTPGSDSAAETVVTVSDATTYTAEQAGNASALTIGRCVSATGETDDTGAVTAGRISVSDQVDGGCAIGGFGSRPGAEGAGS